MMSLSSARHGALERAVVAVVLQQVGVGLGVGEIVEGDDFDLAVGVALLDGAEGDAADAAEAVDADANCHMNLLVHSRGRCFYREKRP